MMSGPAMQTHRPPAPRLPTEGAPRPPRFDRGWRIAAWVSSLALLASPAVAQDAAQPTLNLQRLLPALGSSSFVAVEEGRTGLAGGLRFDLLLSYAHQPLEASGPDLARRAPLVEGLFSTHLRAGWSFAGWGELALSMPVLQVANVGGPLPELSDTGPAPSSGDLELRVRFAPLDDERTLGLGLHAFVTAPTGRPKLMLSAGVPTVGGGLVLSRRFGPVRIAAQASYRFVPGGEALTGGATADDSLDFGGAVGVDIPPIPLELGAEVFGSAGLGPLLQELPEAQHPALHIPVELLGSARITLPAGLSLRIAAGPGLTAAPGSPVFRAVFGLSWTPTHDDDDDGRVGPLDRCPEQPEDLDGFEDLDGCPDPDNDGDGIPDADDRCRGRAEDFDGWEDLDGCPDPDDDGDGLLDADDRCPRSPEVLDGNRDEDGCPDDVFAILGDDHIVLLEPIAFGVGDTAFAGTAALKDVASILLAHPDITLLQIEGHASHGDDADSLSLSERRAVAVMRWLAEAGVDPGRLEAVGRGNAEPGDHPDRIELRLVSP